MKTKKRNSRIRYGIKVLTLGLVAASLASVTMCSDDAPKKPFQLEGHACTYGPHQYLSFGPNTVVHDPDCKNPKHLDNYVHFADSVHSQHADSTAISSNPPAVLQGSLSDEGDDAPDYFPHDSI